MPSSWPTAFGGGVAWRWVGAGVAVAGLPAYECGQVAGGDEGPCAVDDVLYLVTDVFDDALPGLGDLVLVVVADASHIVGGPVASRTTTGAVPGAARRSRSGMRCQAVLPRSQRRTHAWTGFASASPVSACRRHVRQTRAASAYAARRWSRQYRSRQG